MNGFIPALTVTDMNRSVRFYEEALGFTSSFTLPGSDGQTAFTYLMNGETQLMLSVPGENEPATVGALGAGVNLYVNVDGSADIDALFERAWNAGARVVQKPSDQYWGDRNWSVADPDGYRITVGKQVRVLSPDEMVAAATATYAPAQGAPAR